MSLNLKPVDEELHLRPVEPKLNLKAKEEKVDLQLKPVGLNIKPLSISREEDRFSQMSKFGKVLDILGRPGYAIKSILNQQRQDSLNALKNAGYPINSLADVENLPPEAMEALGQKGENIKGLLEATWRGLSGKERIQANALWDEVGIKGIPFLGFATEIATDPLMWFGGAGYKLITKTISKGTSLVSGGIKAIPGVSKATTILGAKIQPVAHGLKEIFITKTGIGKLGDLIDKHLLNREYLKGKELKFGVKIRTVIQNISAKTKQSVDDIEKQIVNLIEQPNMAIGDAATETKVLANTIKSHLSNILTKEMKAGVSITALSENARHIQYFPRITTKEAREYFKQAKIGNSKIWNTKLDNALRRKTGDFTLDEFNAFAAEHGLKSLGGRSVEEFFIKHPAYAVAVRGTKSAKAVTSAQFLDDVAKTFGKTEAPAFWQELPDSVTNLNPSLKGLKFDPEVMSEITRVTTSYFNPNEAKLFVKSFDAVQNIWKKWTLAPFPKYHLRNMVGNMWNNYLANVNPRHYPRAQAIQMYRKYKTSTGIKNRVALENLKRFGITTQMADDIIIQAEKTGVLGHGWYAADIETGIQRAIQGDGLIGKGMAFGATIENNARLAHFLDKIEKGDDAFTAAKSVKKFLFDYQDLTAFEKQIMKRLFPFYTWTRKNVPLQAQQLWQQPEKYMVLSPALRSRDEQDLLRLKYARPDLYERLPIEIGRTVDTVTYMPLEGVIPAGDLAKMVRPQELFVELLTPYLRAPIELGMNKSFYFESEIQKYPNETQELLRMDIPVKFTAVSVLPQARLLNEINKIVKKQMRKEELTAGEQTLAQTLSSIYKVNLKDLRDRGLRNVEKKIEDLKRGKFWAKRYERTREGVRIKETYNQLKKLMKEIKGY